MVASFHSAKGVYGAAKAGANGLEHGLLAPVRDWVLLPAFGGIEHAVGGTVGFLESPQAARVAHQSLRLVQRVPLVGDNILAPVLCKSVDAVQKAWQIAQYPIPSRTAVRESVDTAMTTTKWALTTAGREIYLYAKRLDANITRTLSHTQWRVLGSGPYTTLDKLHRVEIVDHVCERYLSTEGSVARYELTAHIRAHNTHLYHDVVLSGLLRERATDPTHGHDDDNDEEPWLSVYPSYRKDPFLIVQNAYNNNNNNNNNNNINYQYGTTRVQPLFFRLVYQNGKRPGKDVPWVTLPDHENQDVENAFQAACRQATTFTTRTTVEEEVEEEDEDDDAKPVEERHPLNHQRATNKKKYPTVARWYTPDRQRDVLVDQKRHAVSLLPCCPSCRQVHKAAQPPLAPRGMSDLCDACQAHARIEQTSIYPPALSFVMRPTLWRFHGPGDEIRRGVWFLDTQRNGPQPYSDESAAVLEDAYQFLKWHIPHADRNGNDNNKNDDDDDDDDAVLLTVQVTSPDGLEQQLVQFSSLLQVTAIQKTLGGAISLFKRRVYRGIAMPQTEKPTPASPASILAGSLDECDLDSVSIVSTLHTGGEPENTEEAVTPLALPYNSFTGKTKPDDTVNSHAGDDAGHLVLIVHGIGEMLRSIDLFGMSLPNLSSIVDCCGYLRKHHDEVYKRHDSLASVSGRVEYLPVEWHEAFSMQSMRQPCADLVPASRQRNPETTMNDISLRTIPQLRAFANDTLLDVLFFMSPAHHDTIIDIVTNEMNTVVQKFTDLTGFTGTISVIGHSLGSIITWDIFANQIVQEALPIPTSVDAGVTEAGDQAELETDDEEPREALPPTTEKMYPQLSFAVENAFMMGSPISVFLMIRNQHSPLAEDFYLPGCERVFNIFHPYDPVAYRIEPLIASKNADVEPCIVPHWYGGYRAIYKTKRIWQRIVDETAKTQQNVVDALEAHMTGIGLLDSADVAEEDEDENEASSQDIPRHAVCGSLNQGRRIDYMLQEKEIEHANEYVAALAAHSCYWIEKDLSLFLAREIARASLEAVFSDEEQATPNSAMTVSLV